MRLALSLILTSVVTASVGNFSLSGPAVMVDRSAAGQSVHVTIRNGGARPIKLRTWIKDRNGVMKELPSVPGISTPPQNRIEGPVIPPEEGGGTVIVEVVDADTGERLAKGGAPISY